MKRVLIFLLIVWVLGSCKLITPPILTLHASGTGQFITANIAVYDGTSYQYWYDEPLPWNHEFEAQGDYIVFVALHPTADYSEVGTLTVIEDYLGKERDSQTVDRSNVTLSIISDLNYPYW